MIGAMGIDWVGRRRGGRGGFKWGLQWGGLRGCRDFRGGQGYNCLNWRCRVLGLFKGLQA